jgi:phosphate starvation-inducible PhoH-like protein
LTITHPAKSIRKLDFEDPTAFQVVCGQHSEHLRAIERHLGLTIGTRGTSVSLEGDDVVLGIVDNALRQLYALAKRGQPLYLDDVLRSVDMIARDENTDLSQLYADSVVVQAATRRVAPKGQKQKEYLEAIRNFDVVFGVGPAGTGKTYLAMAMAVQSYMAKEVKRIVLTRPAVEAGEKLGFLPGDLAEKVNPYLRPLYDALNDMMDMEKAHKLLQRGIIEVAPLAFMRGRTLNDSFVILDEAQNTTREQMKMFLTRLGFGSKAVITGDVTQVDLPSDRQSGLVHAGRVLAGIRGISFVQFSKIDVVRHPLVARIVEAYENVEAEEALEQEAARERRRQMARAMSPAPERDGASEGQGV